MVAPVSVPVVPAQPNQAIYGLSELALFRDFLADPRVKARDAYLQAFGVPAPNWDASWPAQYWFDSTVDTSKPGNVAVYESIQNQGAAASIVQVSYPATRAAVVNIPGLNSYPIYSYAPTATTIAGIVMDAVRLSSQQDALNMAAELGLGPSTVFDDSFTNPAFMTVYPSTETRRMWAIMYQGVAMFVGELIAAKYAKGIGHPGSWQLTPAGAVWTSTPDGPDGITAGQPSTIVPVPVRQLLANEKFQETLVDTCLVRTDLQSTQTGSGDFTATDRATLTLILQKITSFFG